MPLNSLLKCLSNAFNAFQLPSNASYHATAIRCVCVIKFRWIDIGAQSQKECQDYEKVQLAIGCNLNCFEASSALK